jgi:HK97 family phage major capsid protein
VSYVEISDLQTTRLKAWNEAKAEVDELLNKGVAPAEFPAEVKQRWDRANQDIDGLRAIIEEKQATEKRHAYFNTVDTAKRLPVEVETKTERKSWREAIISDEVKALNAALSQGIAVAQGRKGLDTKAMSLTDADGGFLTPTIYLRQFVDLLYHMSHVRVAGAKVIPMNSDVMKVPNLITSGTPGNIAAASIIAEAGAFSDVSATIGEVTFTAVKMGALTKASDEVVADAQFPLLETIILPQFAQSFAARENVEFTTGDGTGNAQGIVTAVLTDAGQIYTAASATAIAGNDLIKLYHTLLPQYRSLPSVGWMAHDSIIRDIRLLRDDTGGSGLGNYLWQPGLQAGVRDTILGKPVFYNNSMDASAPAAGEESVILGAFDYYWIAERGAMDIRVLNELYAANGQVAFQAWRRYDGRCMNTEAFVVMQH